MSLLPVSYSLEVIYVEIFVTVLNPLFVLSQIQILHCTVPKLLGIMLHRMLFYLWAYDNFILLSDLLGFADHPQVRWSCVFKIIKYFKIHFESFFINEIGRSWHGCKTSFALGRLGSVYRQTGATTTQASMLRQLLVIQYAIMKDKDVFVFSDNLFGYKCDHCTSF